MTTKQTVAVIAALIVAVGVFGGYKYLFFDKATVTSFSTPPTTFGTAKFAGAAVNLAAPGANGTSTSILNTDANDRYVTVLRYACQGIGTSRTAYTGAGLATLTVTAATTSVSAPGANGTNSIGGGSTTIGTSTTQTTIATSTSGTTNIYFVWASGSYLTFTTNATNTALCTFGADYTAS